jgi:dihydroneopterin aldolase
LNDRIEITGIEVYAKHGVLESEKERAQVFRVDVSVFTDLSVPGKSDDLADTLDYSELALEVREVVGAESHKLIETVATRVAEAMLGHPEVARAVVTIHKPQAPIDLAFDDVSVTIERHRDSFA